MKTNKTEINGHRKDRKAQLEIVGLVFIVIIVSFAMLIYISYSVSKEDKKLYKQYADNELGASFASVLTKTNVCGVEMSKLMEDCATTRKMICEGQINSCEMINRTILYILDSTLDRWDESYGVTIRWTDLKDTSETNPFNWRDEGEDSYYFDETKWIYTRRNCTEETTGIMRPPGISPIPVGRTGDTISVEIGICAQ